MLYTKHATLTTTALTTLFTVPNGFHAVVLYVFVSNPEVATNKIDLYWDLSGTPQVYIFEDTNVTGGGRQTIGNGGGPLFVLHQNEAVKCQSNSAGNLEVVVTFDLIEQAPSLINFNGS